MEAAIIGREEEKRQLNNYIGSPQSEFVAIYGRRRIGKTFLVKEMFEGRFTFRMTGTKKTLIPTYITPFGLTNNMYSRRLPRQVIVEEMF